VGTVSGVQVGRRRIGILVIATGRYHRFVPGLAESLGRFFCGGHDVRLFLFTDAPELYCGLDGVTPILIPHEPWPLVTLLRYHRFCDHKDVLASMDLLFYCDVDMRVVSNCGEEVFPDVESGLVGVEHPGYCNMPRPKSGLDRLLERLGMTHRTEERSLRGPYESNPQSTAYVRPTEGNIYFCGGFNGGTTSAFLRMAGAICRSINADLSRNYIAVWHDESHLNRYFIDHPPKVLAPSYAYPESSDLPFRKMILALDKDHDEVRGC